MIGDGAAPRSVTQTVDGLALVAAVGASTLGSGVIDGPVELRAPGIRLRPWLLSDAPAVLEARTDDAIAMWSPDGGGSDPRSVQEFVCRSMDWSSGRQASFALEDDTGAFAGSVRLYRIDWNGRHADVGYWTAANARGRGLTSLAVDTLARWALDVLGLHRLDLYHAVANPASCRVAQKAGFALEQVLRRSYQYGDGRLYDEHRHVRHAVAA